MQPKKLYLASASPRRRELLAHLGIPFTVISPNVDETCLPNLSPQQIVIQLAERKALAACQLVSSDNPSVVLGADTIVAINEYILGKPTDRADARRMLNLLSGKTHSVFTGVALAELDQGCVNKPILSCFVETKVTFRQILPPLIEKYLKSEESLDKAGAYGIQGGGSAFVIELLGDYFNVVGFPVSRVAVMFEQCGYDWWKAETWLA